MRKGRRMSLLSHKTRLVTGLVLVIILAGALASGGLFLRFLILAAALLALWEFYAMFWPGTRHLVLKILGLAITAKLILLPGLLPWAATVIPFLDGKTESILAHYRMLLLIFAFFAAAFAFLFRFGFGDQETKLTDTAPMPLGFLYIPMILNLAFLLSPLEQMLVVLAAVGSDTGAYYAGCRFGRHKIWPSVSPQKSWEGSLGGMLLCVVLCCLVGWTKPQGLPALSLPGWALLGVALNLSAQFGDFFESALKRSLKVKDSGFLLPGHGGMLDRIDSLLLVLPVYFTLSRNFL